MTVKQHFKGSKSGSHLNRSRHVTQKSPRRNSRLTHRKFSKNFYFVEKQINKKPITVCVCVCECTYVGLVSSWLEKSYKSLFIFFRVWTSSSSSAILTFVFSQSPNTDWKHKQKQAITHHRKKKKTISVICLQTSSSAQRAHQNHFFPVPLNTIHDWFCTRWSCR